MTREEIAEGVREVIAEALDLEPEKVTEDARLIEDLGGDSLDWLDIMFRLEERFYIAASPRGIEEEVQRRLGDKPFHVEGIYTPETMVVLRELLPEVPPEELPDGMALGELPRVFRVATMVNLVEDALKRPPGEVPAGFGPTTRPQDAERIALN